MPQFSDITSSTENGQPRMLNINAFMNRVFFLSVIIFTLFNLSAAQKRIDLEITAQPTAKEIHGGGKLTVNLQVRNLGTAVASEVEVHGLSRVDMGTLLSGSATQGSCETLKNTLYLPPPFVCVLGTIKAGESVFISLEIQVLDFDQPPLDLQTQRFLENYQEIIELNQGIKGYFTVSGNVNEEDMENNRASFTVKALPSLNKAPRIEIISPKNESEFVNPVQNPIAIPVIFKAFDSDGKIQRISVDDEQYQISSDGIQYTFVYRGKTYTAREFEKIYGKDLEAKEKEVIQIGKDTYRFNIRNPKYGLNRFTVTVIDDGGRITTKQFEYSVK
jgi:hypothetical protein